MLVSIITPVHNAYSHIEDTIQSVLNQTFSDWELILVDDYSTDRGMHILNKYEQLDSRIHIYENSYNLGAALSRNRGIEKAQGRYIAFLDSDDLWEPTKLEEQVKFMQDNNYAFTFTGYHKFRETEIIGEHEVPAKVTHEELLKTCSIGCLTAMYDTDQLGKVYMPEISKRQDFALWLKILKEIPYAYAIQKPLAKYRLRGDSISGNKLKAAKYQWRVYREFEHLNFFQSCYYFSHYAVFGVLKTYLHKAKK
ncbi:glycosyltransferase family 2 protein [Algoriphagus halophytocola]|uniref:Glycosyltransferase family 2 protein n=1 Tax=Algoriphagus halophytocola TaxID=2991499 RepID=A0ABY6MJ78_9BACT|nr:MULTISPECIES: glycosyltransferase family 2 protein [unclassified Algoriphagus]UZD23039.1 glycosyltransferase family 2 protein [Algoriphagus sp. TR-M5]WBL44331.1 glycosyltransferase family 2 protein [Algoriphagus sp. TR-M9]